MSLISTADSVPDFKFTPNDLAKIARDKIIEEHYSDLAIKAIIEAEAAVYKRDVNTAERRSLASAGHALPDGSYPIANAGDLHNAAHLTQTGHGNAEGAKRLIARRAKELGVTNPLDSDGTEKEALSTEQDIAVPDAVKDQNGEAGPKVSPKIPDSKKPGEPEESPCPESAEGACKADDTGKASKPAKKPKKGKSGKSLPPWLNKPSGDDSCKMDHVHTEKCHSDPKTASGAEEPCDMQPAPVGELQESPAKDHMKGDSPESMALMRFKTVGIDSDLGILHDLTCPAFHPDEVSKYFPYADFRSINETLWQQRALAAAAGKSLNEALSAQQAWQSAVILKDADPADLGEFRMELHKAFRDANPGPSSFPTPGMVAPQRFHRPNIGGGSGQSQDGPGYGAPNSSPQGRIQRPGTRILSTAPAWFRHQSPSPSFT